MSASLKPIDEQTIVLVGASSGMGLATARMAAERGARVVLAARSEDALAEATEEIEAAGGEATYVVADVIDRKDVREIARTAEEEYGGFDTWINFASAFIYGELREVPVEEMREQFETNVWGTLYGSLEAADRLENGGGALINVGSVASDRALPLQGSYSASKHAVKGFTDALRMELEADGAPISVTLVKPASIDTPYPEHAKNYMDEEATLPPPLYDPDAVARAILNAAEHPQRDVIVGGGGLGLSLAGYHASGVMDSIMEKLFYGLQRTDRPSGPLDENNVDGPSGDAEVRGDYEGHVASSSLYTRLAQRRSVSGVALAGIGAAALYAYRRAARRRDESTPDADATATERVASAVSAALTAFSG